MIILYFCFILFNLKFHYEFAIGLPQSLDLSPISLPLVK